MTRSGSTIYKRIPIVSSEAVFSSSVAFSSLHYLVEVLNVFVEVIDKQGVLCRGGQGGVCINVLHQGLVCLRRLLTQLPGARQFLLAKRLQSLNKQLFKLRVGLVDFVGQFLGLNTRGRPRSMHQTDEQRNE